MTRRNNKSRVFLINSALMLISGIGVGWLIGLAISPVLHIIVGALVTLVAGVVGALVGVRSIEPAQNEKNSDASVHLPLDIGHSLSPLPLTMLVIGLAAGSCLGIYARTNDLLGPNPNRFARKWAGTGLEQQIIQERLFNELYPESQGFLRSNNAANTDSGVRERSKEDSDGRKREAASSGLETSEGSAARSRPRDKSALPQYAAALYGVSAQDCGLIRLRHGRDLREYLLFLGNPDITAALKQCNDDRCVEALKELICSTPK